MSSLSKWLCRYNGCWMIVEHVHVVEVVRENVGVKFCCLYDFDGKEYDV
jgi:hypothetical protein